MHIQSHKYYPNKDNNRQYTVDEEKSTRLKHYKELVSSNRPQTNAECERNCPPHETACHWIIQYQLVSPKIIHTSNFIMTERLRRLFESTYEM